MFGSLAVCLTMGNCWNFAAVAASGEIWQSVRGSDAGNIGVARAQPSAKRRWPRRIRFVLARSRKSFTSINWASSFRPCSSEGIIWRSMRMAHRQVRFNKEWFCHRISTIFGFVVHMSIGKNVNSKIRQRGLLRVV